MSLRSVPILSIVLFGAVLVACEAPAPDDPGEPRLHTGQRGLGECVDGFLDCDGDPDNGCETDTWAEPGHCGGCGNECPADACGGQAPACEQQHLARGIYHIIYPNCDTDGDGIIGESDLPGAAAANCNTVNVNYCIESSRACARGQIDGAYGCTSWREDCGEGGTRAVCTCELGECPAGRGDCDGRRQNGCEADLLGSVESCGACGATCEPPPHAAVGCADGECVLGNCAAGWGNCDGDPANGCEANLWQNPLNCGACGAACDPAACPGGAVRCEAEGGQAGLFYILYPQCDANGDGGITDADMVNGNPPGCNAADVNFCLEAARFCDRGHQGEPYGCAGWQGDCTDGRIEPSCVCAEGGCPAGQGDCDGDPANGCEADLSADPGHCGACGQGCPTPAHAAATCTEGVCGMGPCAAGWADCDGDPANGCETALDTLANCGACGAGCAAPPNGAAACVAGACTLGACAAGWANCDGGSANGCEADLSSVQSCGACGNVCPAPVGGGAPTCEEGICGPQPCPAGRGDCDEDPDTGCETDLTTSLGDCGACGRTCPTPAHGIAACVAGQCALGGCAAGWGDCDGDPANGCEVDLSSSTGACGACGQACPTPAHASATCVDGACGMGACAAGWGDCDGLAANGCEASLQASVANCGSCGNVCADAPDGDAICVAGVCDVARCPEGQGDCDGDAANGCETALDSSVANCGGCGNTCADPARGEAGCAAGLCVVSSCDEGYGDCDGDAANGCEADLWASPEHCGGCDQGCSADDCAGRPAVCRQSQGQPGLYYLLYGARCDLDGDGGLTLADVEPVIAPGCSRADFNYCVESSRICAGGQQDGDYGCNSWREDCTNGEPVPVCSCSDVGCAAGWADCDGEAGNGCEQNLSSSPQACGACGNACPQPANAEAVCQDGVCGAGPCRPGFGDCDGDPTNGCEADLRTSAGSCGACGNTCPAPPHEDSQCFQGVCGGPDCDPGYGNCDGDLGNGCETDMLSDVAHCGMCDQACPALPNTEVACVQGECVPGGCERYFGDCDGDPVNGCEAYLLEDPDNCGECGNVCPTPYAACGGGVAVCRPEEVAVAGIYYIIWPQCDGNGDGGITSEDFEGGAPAGCNAVDVNYCIESSRICAGGQIEGDYGCVGWAEDCAAGLETGFCATGGATANVDPAPNQNVIIAGASQGGIARLEDVPNVDYINWWAHTTWINNVHNTIPRHPDVAGTVGFWFCANNYRNDRVASYGGPGGGVLERGEELNWGTFGPGMHAAILELLDSGYRVLLTTTNVSTLAPGRPEPVRPGTQENLYAWNDWMRCLAADLQVQYPGMVAFFDIAALTSTDVNGPLRAEYAAGDQYHLSGRAYQEVLRPELEVALRSIGVFVDYPYHNVWRSGWWNREPRWW